MENKKITPQTILASQPNVEQAMKEFAGIKIIEAVQILLENFSESQKDELMSKIDLIIDSVL